MRFPQSLITFGDSTTQGSASCYRSWPYRLRELCGPTWSAIQFGIGGYTSAQVNTNFSTYCRTSPGVTKFPTSPKRVLFLMDGVNDISGTSASAATVFASVKTPIDAAVADNVSVPGTWARIFFMTPCPCYRYKATSLSAGWDDTKQGVMESLVPLIMAYSGALVTPVNIYSLLGDNSDPRKLSVSTAGGKADYDTWSWAGSDGLHPNDAGHAAIATYLYAQMVSLGLAA